MAARETANSKKITAKRHHIKRPADLNVICGTLRLLPTLPNPSL
jgi:hypothetical protein